MHVWFRWLYCYSTVPRSQVVVCYNNFNQTLQSLFAYFGAGFVILLHNRDSFPSGLTSHCGTSICKHFQVLGKLKLVPCYLLPLLL